MTLKTRQLEPELMDDPEIETGDHDRALEGLARLNRLARAAAPFQDELGTILASRQTRRLEATADDRPLVVLDVATGSGDLVVTLERWRRSQTPSSPIHWIACDRSRHALERARARAAEINLDLETVECDVTRDELPACDLVFCSLFLHHLTATEVTTVLRRMVSTARIGGLVTDLTRSRLGWLMAALIPRLVTRSPVVHADAVGSVRAAFSRNEFTTLVDAAGVPRAEVFDSFPERQAVRWRADARVGAAS